MNIVIYIYQQVKGHMGKVHVKINLESNYKPSKKKCFYCWMCNKDN